eukprot:5289268-Prorocentrum_lima.AAC.1
MGLGHNTVVEVGRSLDVAIVNEGLKLFGPRERPGSFKLTAFSVVALSARDEFHTGVTAVLEPRKMVLEDRRTISTAVIVVVVL